MERVRPRKCYERVGYPIEFFGDGRTKQSEAEACDINVIVRRHKATGLLPQRYGVPQYLDCTLLPADYQEAMNKVVQAQHAFENVSADVRSRFGNDPAAFVAFCGDPANLDQLREWKLAPPVPKKSATLDDVVSALAAREEPAAT